ncbi:MAG TPA: zinc-dependent alcohol dehydrogenase family protein [Jatrophihabitans sp.]
MKALLYERFQQAPTVQSVPDPVCPPDGVLIDVAATGLCRSDWHGWMGHDPTIRLPQVPGHEFAGTVSEVGPDVQQWRVGDRVTVPFVCACGVCAPCRAGEQQVCDNQSQPGFTQWGSFAERVAVNHADINLVSLPASIDFVTAASLGCRFSTAYRALIAHGRIQTDQWVAVHGCGGVGLSAVMIGVSRGAHIIAIDTASAALDLAVDLGAAATIDATNEDVPAAVRRISAGGAHVSIDALGSVMTCGNSILSLRKRGRHVQVGLMVADADPAPLPMAQVVANELEIYGSHGMAAHSYPELLADISAGRLDPGRLVADQISLDNAGNQLATMAQRRTAGITIITPNG